MIRANDLRIDNTVTLSDKTRTELFHNQINARNEFFKVKTIYSDNDVSLELDDEIVDLSEKDIEPIPLTEEILLKCGFDVCGSIIHHEFFWTGSLSRKGLNYPNLEITVNTLHQLQNLYFALTGKELEIKL